MASKNKDEEEKAKGGEHSENGSAAKEAEAKKGSDPPPKAEAKEKKGSDPPPKAEAKEKKGSDPPPKAEAKEKADSDPPPKAEAKKSDPPAKAENKTEKKAEKKTEKKAEASAHKAVHADAHGHAAGHHKPNRREYMVMFVVLLVLTVLEVGIAQVPGVSKSLMRLGLVGLAVTKAACVGLYYMHLKSETKTLKLTVFLPFTAPAIYALVLISEAAWRLTR